MNLLRFVGFLLICDVCQSVRILGVMPYPSYSYIAAFQCYWKELAARGHDVVLITPHPEKDPESTIKEIDISSSYRFRNLMLKLAAESRNSPSALLSRGRKLSLILAEHQFELPEIAALLQNATENFDLVVTTVWHTPNFGFAERFKCPLIAISSLDLSNSIHELIGNPTHPVAYPDIFLGQESLEMNFWQRIFSILDWIMGKWNPYFEEDINDSQKRLWQKYFGADYPNNIYDKVSIMLLNVHPVLNPRPQSPRVINVGGSLHIAPSRPLPKELAEYLDGAKTGAIYVSLGTNVKSDFIPNNVRQAFIGAFAELPYKILWKLDIELPNLPKNVKIVNWLPQQDVLRHPNIKAFVFQGGLQSLEEAIANKIPVVGIPFISDQDTNVRKLVKNGFGLGLDKDTITSQSLKEAILEIIKNSKYKAAITKMADIISDQPMTGLEKAVWWTEYVIRHKGAPHLRNPIMDIPFYQYYLLDVISFCLGVLAVSIFVSYKLIAAIKSIITKKLARKSKVN